MIIVYLIKDLSSNKFYFESRMSGVGNYFIPNGNLATIFSSYEEAEEKIKKLDFKGLFQIIECHKI